MNKLELLKPEARRAVELFVASLEKHGYRYTIIETLRTQETQDAYYAQGRLPLEEVNLLRRKAGLYAIGEDAAKRIITKVKYSVHQDGRAADIAPVANGKIPWDINSETAPLWLAFGKLGIEAGLGWGGLWEPFDRFGIGWDAPHYEMKEAV